MRSAPVHGVAHQLQQELLAFRLEAHLVLMELGQEIGDAGGRGGVARVAPELRSRSTVSASLIAFQPRGVARPGLDDVALAQDLADDHRPRGG